LQKAVVDPIPDVRGVGARALAGIVRGVGEEELPTLLPWLITTLQSDTSTVERRFVRECDATVQKTRPNSR
jgi:hypothetical protein